MDDDYDECRSNLAELAAQEAGSPDGRNEATTRIHLVDRLFLDCLGWSRNDVRVEEACDTGYADYTFFAPRRVLVVEAKREGVCFEVPAGKDRLEYSLPSLIRDSGGLKTALDQVARYCQSRGVPFGAVSNGHQAVAFVATRNDGRSPLEGKALVFPSLTFMLDHFLDLWNALSKPGIERKCLHSRLIGDILPELPAKLAARILQYPGVKGRNVFQTDLQIVSELVFEDLIHSSDLEPQFLEECYCPSGALSQHSLMSKRILEARYAALFSSNPSGPTPVPAVEKEGVSSELLAESLSRRPILLVGDVGVGKTTFTRYLVRVDAAVVFGEAITFYLDLGSQGTLAEDLKEYVLDNMVDQLREQYGVDIDEARIVRAIYHGDLERFRRGIYGTLLETDPSSFREKELQFLADKTNNREQHLRAALGHLAKGQKKQIVVFLDNADQRTDDIQQQAFLIAQELAQHWPAAVFVSLRPETFHRSVRRGALSGYHPKAFTISPPRIDRVIETRLRFALKITGGMIPLRSLPKTTTVQLSRLATIIHVFLATIERDDSLVEFIDNISGGNVRMSLDLVKSFFGSGHVDTQKIVDIEESGSSGGYIIPLHEFLRAVIFGDGEYYDPSQSPIVNLFDLSCVDPKDHFLLPLVIGLLEAQRGTGMEGGFVETPRVYERLQGIGFTPEQLDWAITKGCRTKLIETASRLVPDAGQAPPQSLRATTIGLYHVNKLCRLFPYVDAIVVDTPILDRDVRDSIRDVQTIMDRLDRADLFCQYLDRQWCTLSDCGAAFNWAGVSTDLKHNIQRVRTRAGVRLGESMSERTLREAR